MIEPGLETEAEKAVGEIASWRELEEGLNTIYIIETAEEDYILKLHTNKEEGFSEGYRRDQKARFRAEARIYSRVSSETDIPSPEIVYTDFSEEKVPHQFYIMEKMEGFNLDTAKNSMDEDELADIIEEYGRLLGELHSRIEFEGYGLLIEENDSFGYLEQGEGWPETFDNIIGNLIEMIYERWKKPPEIDRSRLKEALDRLPEEPKPALIHSDNRLENVLVKDGKISAFLDWSFTRSGHALYDLARAEYLLIDYDLRLDGWADEQLENFRDHLFEGYSENFSMENYRENREFYRYATVLWIAAGFPNWSSGWEEEARESFRQNILDWLEKEKPS